MPLYHIFDHKFSVHKFWSQVLLKGKVQTLPVFLRSRCLGSGTRRSTIETMSSSAELCHIWSTVSPWRFISLRIVFWHARWVLTVTPFFSLSDKYSCNLSSWINSLCWINLWSPLVTTAFLVLILDPDTWCKNSDQRYCYFGYCYCHPWSNKFES